MAAHDPKPSSILLKADIDVHDAFRERQHSSVSTIRQLMSAVVNANDWNRASLLRWTMAWTSGSGEFSRAARWIGTGR